MAAMSRRPRLTKLEIEALLAAAGNIDPCMFDEMADVKEGERLAEAWLTGLEKLHQMLANPRGDQ